MSVYVGIDVHRKRSQVAVVTGEGQVQLNRNVVNGSKPMLRLIGGLPAGTPVAFESAYGWGWLIGLLEDYGFDPHMVHPLRCKAIASARLKNDKVDAAILAQLLRADLLPEAWIAPLEVRQLTYVAVCGRTTTHGRHPAEEAHGGGDPLERQVGGHHQVVRSRLHLRASRPGQVRHGSESTSGCTGHYPPGARGGLTSR
jgi:hypothetical protein